MSFWDHTEELRRHLLRIITSITLVTILAFAFSIKDFTFNSVKLYYPSPELGTGSGIAGQLFNRIKEDLLWSTVQVIVTEPSEAIVSTIYISMFLGIILSMPIILYEIGSFITPALYPQERKLVLKLVIPTSVLFLLGALFAYIFVIPFSLEFLYKYAFGLADQQFITIGAFISFIIFFMLGFGISFQLPIIMIALSSYGIIQPQFWRKNMAWAFMILAIFGAVVTPDGSGLTMWLITVPMMGLYIGGWFISTKYKMDLWPRTTEIEQYKGPNLRGLTSSTLAGAFVLGGSIYSFEFGKVPLEATIFGLFLIGLYITAAYLLLQRKGSGLTTAISAGIIGLLITFFDPAFQSLIFERQLALLSIINLIFVLIQFLILFYGLRLIFKTLKPKWI